MHCGIKHVTIVEIHMLILDDCNDEMYFKIQNSECQICCKKVLLVKISIKKHLWSEIRLGIF